MRSAALFVLSACAWADVTLPALLTDRMVVQRGLPVHVWGKAAPGEAVSVTFRGERRSGAADAIGNWSVFLSPAEAGGPFEMTIQAANRIVLKDILIGDVWIASGQSNMEWPVRNSAGAAAEIASANQPRIRLFRVENTVATYPLDDAAAKPWAVCSPETAAGFSAVAYFFARDLQGKLQVPIGLIETAWGGTPAEAWTSLRALSQDASLMPVFAEWARMTDGYAQAKVRREQQLSTWDKSVAEAKAAGRQPPAFPWQPNEKFSWSPAGLYNAMIAPLTPFAIRGAIWYQGESNAGRERAPLYERLFQTMIQDWRRAWGQGDFPFLFVQLANFKTAPDAQWPLVREAQRQTLSLANTGMAVTIDIGEAADIHPRNKQEVGRRLALAARAIAYGEKLVYSGPLFRQATPEGTALRLWFDHAGAGLEARGGPLRGFEIAGADGKFIPAEARIEAGTVVVSSSAAAAPRSVRYAWSDNPDANLFNSAGLPASPFHSPPQ
jgi:sialate O-acetylesterase